MFSLVGPMTSMLPTLTVKLSVIINPILYVALNSQVDKFKILSNSYNKIWIHIDKSVIFKIFY